MICFCLLSFKTTLSGWQDSNLRPPGPKPGAITGLRYIPNVGYLSTIFKSKKTVRNHFVYSISIILLKFWRIFIRSVWAL